MPVPALVWLAFNVLGLTALRRVHPPAQSRAFGRMWWALCAVAMAPWLVLAWSGWQAFDEVPLWAWYASIALELSTLGMTVGFLAWGPLVAWAHRRARAPEVDQSRREWLQKAGWVVPAGAAAASVTGVSAAALRPMVRHVDMTWPELPAALEGFRIGHFTDIHVGTFIRPETVGEAMEALNEAQCDLVLMTGDLHDDTSLLGDVNTQLARCKAPHGVYGALGNHEYYAGLKEYFTAMERGPMKLLVDEGIALQHNGASLFLAGVDYPFHGPGGPEAVARRSMEAAVKDRAPGAFTVCMAHHPSCWDAAREQGVHLTLSGHTHGGQVALAGASLFGGLFKYMLGKYESGASRLYVSSGLGHWFPFRLGLPPEVVVYTLRRATA